IGPEYAIVFGNDDTRLHYVDSIPNPVVVAVDVDGEQAEVLVESTIANEVVDVVFGDEGALRLQIEAPGNSIILNVANVFFRAVDDHPVPAVVHEQEAGVAF